MYFSWYSAPRTELINSCSFQSSYAIRYHQIMHTISIPQSPRGPTFVLMLQILRSGTNAFTCAACQRVLLSCGSNHREVDTIRFNWSGAITKHSDDSMCIAHIRDEWVVLDRRNVRHSQMCNVVNTMIIPNLPRSMARSDAIAGKVIAAFSLCPSVAEFRYEKNVLDTKLRRISTQIQGGCLGGCSSHHTFVTNACCALHATMIHLSSSQHRFRDAVEFGRNNRSAVSMFNRQIEQIVRINQYNLFAIV